MLESRKSYSRIETPVMMSKDEIWNLSLRGIRRKDFIGGYLGTREADHFLRNPIFMGHLGKRPFFDITAGTGQFPYALAKLGWDVFVNDICYYAASICRLWADPSWCSMKDRYKWLLHISESIDPEKVKGVSGYITSRINRPDVINKNTSRYLDSIAGSGSGLHKFLAGAAFLKFFSFRGRNLVTISPSGMPTKEITPWILYHSMLRVAMKARVCREQLGDKKIWSGFYDSLEAIHRAPIPEGSIIYMDSAWPYKKALGGGNPYLFFAETISSIMRQRQIRVKQMWNRTTTADSILERVSLYIDEAFSKGAYRFVLTTQDTNYPDPDEVFKWAGNRWRLVEVVRSDDYSSNASIPYLNYWGFIAPKLDRK